MTRLFDPADPRKGGSFVPVPEEHDVTDEFAAYKLGDEPFPGRFGVFYKVGAPTKNAHEGRIIAEHRAKMAGLADWQILQKSFDRMK